MTKPPEDDVSPSWGTWEDLLLAFAVNRHGTAAWDSVASELRKRTSDPNLTVTAQNCRLKYLDLKRRFVVEGDDLEDDEAREDKSNAEEAVPLLEELRKLRVAELRREVQRYDLNIESLEIKMKKMEDEREKSSRRDKSETDLQKKSEEKKMDVEPAAEPAAGREPVTGEEMDKDQLSVNESNSTDPGAEKLRTGEKESEPAKTGGEEARRDRTSQTSEEPAELKSEPDPKSAREDSCNGSSNSIEKSDRKAKTEPVSDSADLVESEAESDGGGAETTKENSDVQSSASRSRKEEGSDKVRRGSTSGDEREHEDQSRAVKGLSAQSQPFVDFLQAIRAHKFGSVFERRLRSQESSKYQKLILEHMDLEIVETRVKEGWYSGSSSKFYRDLLLLVNNALVFFNKNSSEAHAASEIRWLISKEISQKYSKSESSSGKQVSLQSLSKPKKDENDSLMLKPRISGSLIVCRSKRSSIAAKADKKKEQVSQEKEKEKEKETKMQQRSQEEPKITKKRTRDRFPSASSSGNSKKNGKNQSNNNKNSVSDSGKGGGKGGSSSSQHVETKSESNKKNQNQNQTTLDSNSKKRGAANFLNRMKQGSSSNNGVLLDALKNTPLTSESKGGSKNENAKRGEKKEQVTRRSSTETRQQAKEKGSPGKRNVGRPPKRGAPPPPPPASAAGKRGRDKGEAEAAASRQPKKRTRKL